MILFVSLASYHRPAEIASGLRPGRGSLPKRYAGATGKINYRPVIVHKVLLCLPGR